MHRGIRYSFIVSGIAALVLAVGFSLQLPWATGLWPWPTSRLSNLFIASILAASAAPVLWIAISGEFAASTGGAIDLCVTYLGMAAFSLLVYLQDSARPGILPYALFCIALALVSLALILWARRIPFRDTRPLPVGVRVAFVIFCVGLVLVGGALVLRLGNVFPWRLTPEQSVLYGWVFLGAASYFLYALMKPQWANAQGQLLGFLAYDLVLIVPFIKHFANVDPKLRINLIVYTTVLIYSGIVAVYYLFVNKATRYAMSGSRIAPGAMAQEPKGG